MFVSNQRWVPDIKFGHGLDYKGAMLMPNTFMMQEIIRREVDYYVDLEDAGEDVEIPLLCSIQKGCSDTTFTLCGSKSSTGTPIPRDLLLLTDGLSEFRFSLRMSIESMAIPP